MSQLNPTRILCSCTRCSSPRGLTYRAQRANLTCCWTLKVFIFKGATPHGNVDLTLCWIFTYYYLGSRSYYT